MKISGSIKDHILIGGPNAMAGWGLLTLVVLIGGFLGGRFIVSNISLWLLLIVASFLTGSGSYAINAVYDIETDKINKPYRPLPSGRMTREHALKYSYALFASGLAISIVISFWTMSPFPFFLWSVFTVLGLAYSVPPLKLKARHIWGNLCFATFAFLIYFIPSIMGTGTISSQLRNPIVAISFIGSIMCMFIGFVQIKDLHDVEGDAKNGDITLPVKIGRQKTAALASIIVAISLFRIPIYPYGYFIKPEFLDIIDRNWIYILLIVNFALYIAFDRIGRNHILSDSLARTMYFFFILLMAYSQLRNAFTPASLMNSSSFIYAGLLIQTVLFVSLIVTVLIKGRNAEKSILKGH